MPHACTALPRSIPHAGACRGLRACVNACLCARRLQRGVQPAVAGRPGARTGTARPCGMHCAGHEGRPPPYTRTRVATSSSCMRVRSASTCARTSATSRCASTTSAEPPSLQACPWPMVATQVGSCCKRLCQLLSLCLNEGRQVVDMHACMMVFTVVISGSGLPGSSRPVAFGVKITQTAGWRLRALWYFNLMHEVLWRALAWHALAI